MLSQQQLSDRLEIQDLVFHYADLIDSKQFDQLRDEVFTTDAHIDYSAMGGSVGDLEETITFLRENIEPVVREYLPEGGGVRYSGAADKLDEALVNLSSSFVLALLILYLLMRALFHSFRDGLLVLLVLPLATVGGVVALWLLNLVSFQPLDLLTMIGFIILLGLVVNNAILLVYQTRAAERQGMSRRIAVEQAVRLRLRPILMTTLTSVFGMLPLLLMPGAGTELYRGLAGVIVGGMLVSTVFTLLLLPAMLRTGEPAAATA